MINRRQALNKAGWILSSTILGPGLVTSLSGCASEANLPADVQVFDSQQYQMARALGDTILPRTKSPSASDVKVPEFMDLLLRDVFEDSKRDDFLKGFAAFDIDCKELTGQLFSDLKEEERYTYLTKLDEEIISGSKKERIPFYVIFKTLCVSIYYSTEKGVKENLDYKPVPGGFEGDVTLRPEDRIEIGNEM